MAATGAGAVPGAGRRFGWTGYAVASGLLVAGILSQYLVPPAWVLPGWGGFFEGLFLAYGIGAIGFLVLVGIAPLRNYFRHNRAGAREGFRWYGILGVLSFVLVIGMTLVYLAVDPRFEDLINKSTSVAEAGASDPYFYMLFSLPVGFIEEALFRGWLFGGVLTLDGTSRWRGHALWTTLVFTGVHVYYGQTYLEVSPLFYVQIFLLGLAFAIAYYKSGGNLLVVALLHASFDVISFASFVNQDVSLGAHYGLLGACALFALALAYWKGPSARNGVGQAPPGPLFSRPGGPGPSPLTFAPVPCPRCGTLVVGDVRGIPTHCPHCGAYLGLPLPWEAVAPKEVRFPGPGASDPGRVSAPPSSQEPPSLPPGAWPPS